MVIHKPRGQIFGHFWPPPPLWSILLNKAYVIKWTFGSPLPLTVHVVYGWRLPTMTLLCCKLFTCCHCSLDCFVLVKIYARVISIHRSINKCQCCGILSFLRFSFLHKMSSYSQWGKFQSHRIISHGFKIWTDSVLFYNNTLLTLVQKNQ